MNLKGEFLKAVCDEYKAVVESLEECSECGWQLPQIVESDLGHFYVECEKCLESSSKHMSYQSAAKDWNYKNTVWMG